MVKVPMSPPNTEDVLKNLDLDGFERIFSSGVKASQNGQYRHWDEVRHREPPDGLSLEEWWAAIKFSRQREFHALPLTDKDGRPFQYMMPDKAWERVHKIDQRLGGRITLSEKVANPATQERYLVHSLIEEAITSSQLEGASTSRPVAKEMIRTGRPPRDTSERMILNNYHAMNFVRKNRKQRLTPKFVLEVHRLVTDRTLDDPVEAGRLQRPEDDRVKVYEPKTGDLLHTPPPAGQLSDRLEKLCDFANGQEIDTFLHPVARAIIVHFWLAYDHPFSDGNGRTARALFYWAMLSQGYWLAEYLSISTILRQARAQYDRAFLHTETDDLDVTYFIMHQLQVTMKSINDLEGYLTRKMAEVKRTEKLIKDSDLNHRQIALLSHALRHPDQVYTAKSHQKSNNIALETSRLDLTDLEDKGLLIRHRVGKAHGFAPKPDLANLLKER